MLQEAGKVMACICDSDINGLFIELPTGYQKGGKHHENV